MSVVVFDDHVDDVLGRLDAVIADLGRLSLVSLGPERLNDVLVRMVRLVSQAQGLQAAVMQEAETAGLAPRFGCRVLATHIAKATNANAKAIGFDRGLAVWLRDFPVFHHALCEGVLTRSHVVELKRIASPKVHSLLVRDQQLHVDNAQNLQWPDWMHSVGYWLNAADPDGELSDPADPAYGMSVRTKANGDVDVAIRMDAITGEAFLAAHDHEVEKLSRNGRENPNTVPMSLRRKNLCALMRLVVRGHRREDGTTPVPLVNLVMSEKVAEDLLARTYGHTTPNGHSPLDVNPFDVPISWDDLDGRCETIRGTPVHPKHALGILLIAKLRRTVMNAKSRVIDLGHDVRLFNRTQRNALLVQSRGQCVDGSQDPFAWLQADHQHPHAQGGPTDLINGNMRSRPNNQAKGDQLNGWWNHNQPDNGEDDDDPIG